MTHLLDTNVLSESSRPKTASRNVLAWLGKMPEDLLFTSAVSIGEVRLGIEKLRPKDVGRAQSLEIWLHAALPKFGSRILPVDEPVAQLWGRLSAGRTVPVIDTYIAATALVHGLTVATRNIKDFAWTGVPTFDPFAFAG